MSVLQTYPERRARAQGEASLPDPPLFDWRSATPHPSVEGKGEEPMMACSARAAQLLSVAVWLSVTVTLVGIGYAIATALDSDLLGFLGADFIFLIAMSLYMSGPGRDRR